MSSFSVKGLWCLVCRMLCYFVLQYVVVSKSDFFPKMIYAMWLYGKYIRSMLVSFCVVIASIDGWWANLITFYHTQIQPDESGASVGALFTGLMKCGVYGWLAFVGLHVIEVAFIKDKNHLSHRHPFNNLTLCVHSQAHWACLLWFRTSLNSSGDEDTTLHQRKLIIILVNAIIRGEGGSRPNVLSVACVNPISHIYYHILSYVCIISYLLEEVLMM